MKEHAAEALVTQPGQLWGCSGPLEINEGCWKEQPLECVSYLSLKSPGLIELHFLNLHYCVSGGSLQCRPRVSSYYGTDVSHTLNIG